MKEVLCLQIGLCTFMQLSDMLDLLMVNIKKKTCSDFLNVRDNSVEKNFFKNQKP